MKLIPETDCPELQRDPKSGVWYYRKYVAGKGEFFRSTRERKSKAKAKAIGLRMFAEWMGTIEAAKRARFLFDDVARMYVASRRNRRKKTIVSVNLHLTKHLLPYFTGWPIDTVAEQWEKYVEHKRRETPDRKFFNDAKHMRSILKLAYEKGMLTRPAKIANPDAKTEVGKEYTEAEIERLLANASGDLRLQIKMAYLMGMRRSEILLLAWERVDLKSGIIELTAADTKTKLPRQVPIHAEVWAELDVRRRRALSPWVFPSPVDAERPVEDNKTAWRNCREAARVDGRFHDLRHTCVTRMLFVFNIPPAKVAAIVGMSLAVMQRYSHPKGKHLRDVMDSIRGISGSILKQGEKDSEIENLH